MDDDDFWEDEPGLDTTQGHHQPVEGSAMSEVLTGLVLGLTQARLPLSVMDPDEFKALAPLLTELRDAFDRLPTAPKPKRSVGFKVEGSKPAKGRGRKTGRK